LLLIRDGVASVCDAITGTEQPLDHGGPIESAAFSPDGSRALTIGKHGVIRVWDAKNWNALARIDDRENRKLACFSPNNRFVACWGVWMGGIRALAWWDASTGRLIREIDDNNSDLAEFNWRPDSRQLLRASKRGEVTLWDASSGVGTSVLLPRGSPVTAAAYGPDARTLLTASEDGDVCLWDLVDRSEPFPLKSRGKDDFYASLPTLTVDSDGNGYFSGPLFSTASAHLVNGQKRVVTWPDVDPEPIKRRLPPGTRFDGAALSPDRSRVVTSHHDPKEGFAMSLQLWDSSTGQRLGEPLRTSAGVYFSYVAFSPDSSLVVATSTDGKARLLNARTGAPIGRPLEHRGAVFCADFSPDGQLLVTCGKDHMVRLWHTRTGEPAGDGLRHQDVVTLAIFSPDGQTVATASPDGRIRLWDRGGSPLGVLECKNGPARAIQFDPKTSLLLVAYSDGMRFWDIGSRQEVSPAMEITDAIYLKEFVNDRFSVWTLATPSIFRMRTFDMPSDDRPASDLAKLGQLYSGWRLDSKGGSLPLRSEERQALWRELRARYPDEFAISSKTAVEWRLGRYVEKASPTEASFFRHWLAVELAESGWQPGERGSENLTCNDYLLRLDALATNGRHAEATAAAEVLAGRWPRDGDMLYGCACVYALAAGAVKTDAGLFERYATGATALFRRAVDAGYKNGSFQALKDRALKDPDLNALRGRKDFGQVLRDLADSP
jgi:WD40 repeat protein